MKGKFLNRLLESYPDDHEVGGGEVLVETAGYIPKDVQLRLLAQSGKALEAYRNRVFNYFAGADEDYDPTARKDYDFFDCMNDRAFAKSNLERKIEEAERLAKNTPPKVAPESVPDSGSQTPESATE